MARENAEEAWGNLREAGVLKDCDAVEDREGWGQAGAGCGWDGVPVLGDT